jgi:hypothetical protein
MTDKRKQTSSHGCWNYLFGMESQRKLDMLYQQLLLHVDKVVGCGRLG